VTVLVVRHARAGRRDKWKGDDRLRPLSRKGRIQAAELPETLAPYWGRSRPVLRTSPWVRCVETLQPLGAALDVEVFPEECLAEGHGSDAVALFRASLGRRPVVLCTHGDVIEEILAKLTAEGVALPADPPSAKGSVWVFEGIRGAVTGARYLPPQ
jgi:broad specificity phosphatase PhoE